MTRLFSAVSLGILATAVSCRSASKSNDSPPPLDSPASTAPAVPPPAPALPSASVAAFRNADKLPPYEGPVGSVEGTITVTGDPAPDAVVDVSKCPAALDMYGKAFREGAPLPDGSRPLADALVAVTGYSGFYVPERNEVRRVTIQHCAFDSRTIDMTIGQSLEISNPSAQLVGPAFAQAPTAALMVATPHGDPVKLYPLKPAYYTLVDRLGSDFMKADVYVLSYPLHTVTKLDGRYRIDGVPVGRVQVNTRLAAFQANDAKEVEVRANVVEHIDLQLKYKRPSAPGARPL